MKRKWTTRIIGYILFLGFASYILFMVASRSFEARKGKYQQNQINRIYKTNGKTEEEREINFKRFILENVSLNNGVIDFKPIFSYKVSPEELKDKEEDMQLAFDLRIYRVGFRNKSIYTSRYIIVFKELKYRKVKGGDFYDLMYKGSIENNIPSIMDKDFEKHKHNQDLLDLGRIRISLVFDKTPLILSGDSKNKGVASAFVSPANIIFFADKASSLLTRNLKKGEQPSDETIAKITNIKLTHITKEELNNLAKNKDHVLKETPLASISEDITKDDEKAPNKVGGLDLAYSKFRIEKKDIDEAISKILTKKQGKDLIEHTELEGIKGINITPNLKEYNTQPILITVGAILLIIVAGYFLFGHRFVMEIIRAKKEQKKANSEEETSQLNLDDVEDATFTEASSEEQPLEEQTTTNSEEQAK